LLSCSSLRARVLATTTLVCLLVSGGWAAWQAQRMLSPDAGYWDEGLLGLASYVSGSLSPAVLSLPPTTPSPTVAAAPGPQKGSTFQVWRRDGMLIISSPGAPPQALVRVGSHSSQGHRSSTEQYAGQRWRVLVLPHSSGDLEVHTAKPELAMRNDLIRSAVSALPVVAVLLATLLAGLWLAVGWSVAGVRGVQHAIERRGERDLTPIPLGRLPMELRPIVSAFNQLLERLSVARGNEKRFISNAAHELRTPLAALRAQAQVTQRMSSEPAVAESLRKLTAIIDRASRLANQLLTFARFEAASAAVESAQTLSLDALTLDVAREFSELARQRTLHVRVQVEPAQVRGDADQISALLRNLIDNAVRYTPEGGSVQVECRAADASATLSVADDGPGIPQAEHALVFERFYRGQEARASGSGLGLSIVREVVERHHGSVRLLSGVGGGGLKVEVRLPALAAATP
jgi:two-component system, OmpR family, sensor histidine kinase QseC